MGVIAKMVSGIYKIESKDGKVYIGSAINIKMRWAGHKYSLNKNEHHNKHLQNAWNKYGAEYFTFSVIEEIADRTRLLYYEQIWLGVLFSSLGHENIYNVRVIAESCYGLKRSEESKHNMSLAHKGKVSSEETKQKLSELLKGNKRSLGYKQTQEHKNNAASARAKTYTLRAPNGEVIEIYNMKAFCREHGYSDGFMNDLIKGRKKSAYGYTRIERGNT